MMNLTMRITFYMRFMQIFAKRIGQSKIRSFAAFKFKKFYIGFRPVQKLKQHANAKRMQDEKAFRETYERMQSLLNKTQQAKMALDALLPK